MDAEVSPAPDRGSDLARGGENTLDLRVPQHRPDGPSAEPVIDAVILNWIELSYPREPRIGSERFTLPRAGGEGRSGSSLVPASPLAVYGASGSRFDRGNMRVEDYGKVAYDLAPPAGSSAR